MPDYTFLTTTPLAYFYVEKKTSMDQNEIGAAMGEGFQAVYGHMMSSNVTPSGEALAVYLKPPAETMTESPPTILARPETAYPALRSRRKKP